MIRKKFFNLYSVLCILSALALSFTGCKEEEPQNASLNGNVAAPTWTAPTSYDYSSSMTAVVKISLAERYPSMAADWKLMDDDKLAAFNGDVCLGVASPNEGLFYLYVAGMEGAVTLRYYSAHYKNLFEAKDAFVFKNDDHLGTVAEPLTPDFIVVK